jgi:excisionase family DNA binding protein
MIAAVLSKRDAAAYLGVATRTLDRLCAARLVRFSLVGSRRRFRTSDLDAYLSSRSFGPHRQPSSVVMSIQ